MDIAALSTQMSQSRISEAASLRVLSLVKEQAETQGQQLAQMLQQSVQPHLGGNIDVKI